ncbi:MAG: metalloregulator ArsR/SmtB family transcription factor [Clostridiales bacterium]|nr:metalloregulator ArsR/SmtB family transcription factor [Clostridiales bacterium]MCD8371398.1 metalloregulator ArsR/SmtB family transcription factor [Clostridiales bacterium]
MAKVKELEAQFHHCMPLFIALGDEVRLRIIEVLTSAYLDGRPDGLNVNEITSQTSLSRPAISHHLKILKDSGLVAVRQSGTSNFYRLTLLETNRQLMELGTLVENTFEKT